MNSIVLRRRVRKHSRRRVTLAPMELLEPREMLTGDWHNAVNPYDVDGDTQVSPLDALLVINELNGRQVTDAQTGTILAGSRIATQPQYLDVDADGFVSPLDALSDH